MQQQMLHTRRLPLLKLYSSRLRNRRILDFERQYGPFPDHLPTFDEEEKEENSDEEEEEENGEQGEDFSVADYIQLLSEEERESFKRDNPQLPPLFFMSRNEKKRYFEQMNTKFRQVIDKVPQRKAKTKKILKFRPDFQVRHFDEREKVVAVNKNKNSRESYQPHIHFS